MSRFKAINNSCELTCQHASHQRHHVVIFTMEAHRSPLAVATLQICRPSSSPSLLPWSFTLAARRLLFATTTLYIYRLPTLSPLSVALAATTSNPSDLSTRCLRRCPREALHVRIERARERSVGETRLVFKNWLHL